MIPGDRLYHYTSQAGLVSIVSSKTLWASKIQHLNDQQELKIGLQEAKEALLAARTGEHELTRRARGYAAEKIDDLSGINVFVASFSTERKQLSQWRAYSKGEVGYSLGFFKTALAAAAEHMHFMLAPCVYDPTGHMSVMWNIIEARTVEFEACVCSAHFDFEFSRDEFHARIQADVLQHAPLLKHHDFYEEKEWRLVSTLDGLAKVTQNVRHGLHSLVPYCEFPLVFDEKLLLDEITIGPCLDVTRALDGVRALLFTRGLQNIVVSPTYTPLRHV
jgi:hypothetical protein